jgi:serine/threonine protein kinase
MPPAERSSDAGRSAAVADAQLEQLLAECMARLRDGGADPIEAVCARHPEHASALRRRRDALVALGLWANRSPAVPANIGPFELLRELGRGGMGVVYLARAPAPLNRLVAIKVIGAHATQQVLDRFAAEQRALASLSHPNIAQVLEAGATADRQPWYAMEFVDGQPLTGHCEQRRLDLEARLEHLDFQFLTIDGPDWAVSSLVRCRFN